MEPRRPSYPAPTGAKLSAAQREPFAAIVAELVATKFDRGALDLRLPVLAPVMQGLCATNDDRSRAIEELDDWVRWYRLPGYYLAFLFQQATHALNSDAYVAACVLFSDAQTHFAEDLSLSSLENAYTGLAQSAGIGDAFAAVTAGLKSRLKAMYGYYRRWYGAKPYGEIDPLAENLYFEKAWRDLSAAFPELGSPATVRPETLSSVIEQCAQAADVFCRVVALRHLGLLLAGNSDYAEARAKYEAALQAASAAHLDAEIGHLHRLLGYAWLRDGNLTNADLEFRRAFTHDVHPKFGYWQALSFNEMGDARIRMLPAGLIDPENLPQGVPAVVDAYAMGRTKFESHIGVGVLPIARAIKQQMFRSYADNAIAIAMLSGSQEMLGALEAFGPRYATDVVAESRAAAKALDAASYERYRAARAHFHEHLASLNVAETFDAGFDAYLGDLTVHRSERQFYVKTRNALGGAISAAQSSAMVIERILALRLPETLFLTFNVGSSATHVALIDAASGYVPFSGSVALTQDQLRERHAAYDAIAARSSALLDPAVAMRPALDDLIAFYQATFGDLFDALAPEIAGKHLKLFPRYLMNDMPLHALHARGRPLVDICDVSYAPSLGLLLQIHETGTAAPGAGRLAILRDAARTPAYAGTLAQIAARPNDTSVVVQDPSWDRFRAALAAHVPTDIFFACHGRFDPDDPQRSRLFVTANEPVAFTQIFADLDLRDCRSVLMGACESGIGRTLVSAEYIGLPLAFFAAGVPYCIGTLWQVNQLAAAVFVALFYAELHGEKRTVASCIGEAARRTMTITRADLITWLYQFLPDRAAAWELAVRKLTDPPYAHPYYWAGFYLTGDV